MTNNISSPIDEAFNDWELAKATANVNIALAEWGKAIAKKRQLEDALVKVESEIAIAAEAWGRAVWFKGQLR